MGEEGSVVEQPAEAAAVAEVAKAEVAAAEAPATGAASTAAASAGPGAADAGVEPARAARLFRGWYVLGLSVQVVFWALIFVGLITAIAVGGHLTEFRYVGF